MSKTIVTKLSFNKDLRGVKYSCYSSNLYPHTPYDYVKNADSNESTLNFISSWVYGVVNGEIEIPKRHKLLFYIEKLNLNEPFISLYSEEFHGKWKHDENDKFGIVWIDEKAKESFESYQKRCDDNIKNIATSFINGTLESEIKVLKTKSFIITNGYVYVTYFTRKGYRYSGDKKTAKVINGLEIHTIPYYLKERFSIIEVQ